jgi:mannose-6-phosphate isomerase-like protein (cupin superfamily)
MENNIPRRTFVQSMAKLTLASAIIPAAAMATPPPPEELKPLLVKQDEGERFSNPSSSFTGKLMGHHTNGNLAALEITVNDGWLVGPPHLHQQTDEIMYVQEGTITMLVGTDVINIPAGSWHFRPRKIIHTYWNKSGKPAKIVELISPGGFEEYLKKLCSIYQQHGKIDASEVEKFIRNYDIEPRFDLLQPLIEKYGLKF